MDTSPRDMVWNEFIREQFGLVHPFTTDESELYGPYNALLGDLCFRTLPGFSPVQTNCRNYASGLHSFLHFHETESSCSFY